MIVSMWMTRNPVTVGPHTGLVEAAALMAAKHIRRLVVAAPEAAGLRLLGIVSATDLIHAFPPNVNPFGLVPEAYRTSATVDEIMHRDPVSTTPDAPIEEAARVMRDLKIGALPVLQQGALVGLITESDIFRAFVTIFEMPPGAVRITFDTSKNTDTLGTIGPLACQRNLRVLSLLTAKQHERPVCVVRVTGADVTGFVDDLWKSGHHVLNVLRAPQGLGQEQPPV